MDDKKPRKRGELLFAAICWSVTALIWAGLILFSDVTRNDSSQLTLHIIVMVVSLGSAVLNWVRYARFYK